MYVYVYIYIYAYTHVCMCVSICKYKRICICTCIRIRIGIRIGIGTGICICRCICMYIYICVYVRMCISCRRERTMWQRCLYQFQDTNIGTTWCHLLPQLKLFSLYLLDGAGCGGQGRGYAGYWEGFHGLGLRNTRLRGLAPPGGLRSSAKTSPAPSQGAQYP